MKRSEPERDAAGAGARGDDARLERSAQDDFAREYGAAKFGPVAVIVPSFREAATIRSVLREIPRAISGREVSVLVIVDGDDDGASGIARDEDAYVCRTRLKRGQGAALRLGYRIALAHGSEFLVSLDADGQYVPAEMEGLLLPILRGEADFVSGSRRLGIDGTIDRVRKAGVVVFALLIRVLTRHGVTDPAFGLRAMTAEVARAVTLREPQYQAAELLVGAIMRGFRVAERPATLRRRGFAESRKAGPLAYGLQFARVTFLTWWRER